MITRFRLFLGPARMQALFFLLALTGLGNLILNGFVNKYDWVRGAQTTLVFVFLIGAAVIIVGRLDPRERGRWAGILAPAFGAVILGVFFLPDLLPVMLGGALGWIVAGVLIFRVRGPMAYRDAIRHLRKNRYAEAVEAMDALIKQEPDDINHYRFRAEIFRVWGKLDRARRDYREMTGIEPGSAVAWNGLAEVELEAGNYQTARESALKAFELAPDEWVTAYNLAMIEDRLGESESAIEHLNMAIEAGVPDARHRLLIHLYLARAYSRLGEMDSAEVSVRAIKKHRRGLNEWQIILQGDQADTLRKMIEDDIKLAQALADGEIGVEALAG